VFVIKDAGLLIPHLEELLVRAYVLDRYEYLDMNGTVSLAQTEFFGQILQDYEHVSPVVILNDTEIIHCQLSALKWIIWDVQPVPCGH